MTNLIRQGAGWLSERRTESASELVTYYRWTPTCEHSIQILATLGRTEWDGELNEMLVVNQISHDWLFRAVDLVLDGEVVTPLKGDRIEVVRGHEKWIYKSNQYIGEQVWRYADAYHYTIRLHTWLAERQQC